MPLARRSNVKSEAHAAAPLGLHRSPMNQKTDDGPRKDSSFEDAALSVCCLYRPDGVEVRVGTRGKRERGVSAPTWEGRQHAVHEPILYTTPYKRSASSTRLVAFVVMEGGRGHCAEGHLRHPSRLGPASRQTSKRHPLLPPCPGTNTTTHSVNERPSPTTACRPPRTITLPHPRNDRGNIDYALVPATYHATPLGDTAGGSTCLRLTRPAD